MCRMPESDAMLVSVFYTMGLAVNSGMGLSPFSFCELDAYCNRMKVDFTAWESAQIITMSREYVGWVNKGKSASCVSPWSDEENQKEHNDGMASQMQSWRKNKKPQ